MHVYDVDIGNSGILAAMLDISFRDSLALKRHGGHFKGFGGGLSLAGMMATGVARFHLSLDQMRGWEARFVVESVSFGVGGGGIHMWAMDGRKIGDIEFAGGGMGINVYAGQGRFR